MTKQRFWGWALLGMAATFVGFVVLLFALASANAQPSSQHDLAPTGSDATFLATRPCMFPVGGWALLDCSNAVAATVTSLTAWSRYVVQCGDDTYLSFGGTTADSADGYIPAGAWLMFVTTPTARGLSCLNKNVDSDCRYIKCQ